MGHSSKKKKKRSGGSGRQSSKDGSSGAKGDQDLLADELTALASIFQEDFKIISEPESPHTYFSINLRPYSNDMGFVDPNVSACLLIRCLSGYPHKCPKLQIIQEKGLTKEDTDILFSLLIDQAKVNARQGCVMIFNLVEAAQEFLSEISALNESHESVPDSGSNGNDCSFQEAAASQLHKCSFSDGPFAYSSVDLYSDLCDNDATLGGHVTKDLNSNPSKIFSTHVGSLDMDRNKNIFLESHTLHNVGIPARDDNSLQTRKIESLSVIKPAIAPLAVAKLNIVAEEADNDKTSESSNPTYKPLIANTLQKRSDSTLNEEIDHPEQFGKTNVSDLEGEYSTSSSYDSVANNNGSQSNGKDLLLVHLLRLACSSKGSLANALPEISLELNRIGVLSQWARDLVAAPPPVFSEAFNNAFEQYMASSRFSEFWRTDNSASSKPNSRYLSDFQEVRSLGRGGFGHVALCKNKLDGRQYALKKICLKDKNLHVNEKILREVATLSRLQHKHVVRYYQAWFETEYGDGNLDSASGSRTVDSFSLSYLGASSADGTGEHRMESTYLYIQMEYCPRTLRQDFESYYSSFDKEYAWHLFRQIVEGLAHIHSQGIIHRDLTPSNIFFDVRNDIKIGDFGLAKFLKQLDHDPNFPIETTGMSIDGTGKVGTYFYTAPEVEQGWAQINEKVDMYSLGVIFFELWHPFATAMERHIVLSDLKQKGVVPSSWSAKFPREETLLRRLMSPSPSDRPSATELLQHELPPRLEDEWLNDILRTIQTSEDTYVYDRVVSTIFDEERLISKYHQQGGSANMTRDDTSFIQDALFDTGFQDIIIAICKEVFRQHCAKRFNISPLRILDGSYTFNRKTIKLLTQGGNMLELCHELRSSFVNWIAKKQVLIRNINKKDSFICDINCD
ncbi:eIF-2-alpha kinase GCN2 isoform X1 [Canna indica]|uniref:EIF-2-alpha kinase GCN2 isoform X1 n=1 Tax=Canna indica TaxID=4628 RepID=A0AAQ3K5W0_9LILI|nr:eIF-2-alpha kinase GCN2 isoform X1 [Canna indica]